ncbi:hypothetical protein M8818_004312 [Zalaria obscura]|uniref:Uncharacterized protein n=1 Tax=Zalaria obscura TaxID=2024903 RepID=A0ACC3SCB9_9PEZI
MLDAGWKRIASTSAPQSVCSSALSHANAVCFMYSTHSQNSYKMNIKTTCKITVALDWTPNTIHSGLFVASEKGFYSSVGLDVQLLPPDATYSTTPAKRVEKGEADFAICPSESCIAYNESGKMRLQAIYAILQSDASAIVSTTLSCMEDLGRGTYASYNARYEDNIVKTMVTAAGGDGNSMKIETSSGKLSLFDLVKQGKADATWVFLPWEGLEAKLSGSTLHVFKAGDFGVPYGYSPVIARNASSATLATDTLERFVHATRQGYLYAMEHIDESISILKTHCQPSRGVEFLAQSQGLINEFYGDRSSLGMMEGKSWERWLDWLRSNNLLNTSDLQAGHLFTNEFFT